MELILCLSCGEFVPAVPGDTVRPVGDECRHCGGTEFRDIDAGRDVRTD